jgi:hypothetical protein
MTSPMLGEPSHCPTGGSRFSESMQRLHRCLQQARSDEARVETMFNTWQKQWLSRRDEIAHRLEMIENHLSQIVPPAGKKAPATQLVVFSAAGDSNEMTADLRR